MPIEFPSEWKTDAWHGGLRHRFELDGHDAWFIEPETPAGDGRWSWCMVWPEAFVERVGVEDLLKMFERVRGDDQDIPDRMVLG